MPSINLKSPENPYGTNDSILLAFGVSHPNNVKSNDNYQ